MTALAVRYWHPQRGGWYQGQEVSRNRKNAIVEDFYCTRVQEKGEWLEYKKQHRIPLRNVVYLNDTEFRPAKILGATMNDAKNKKAT